MAEDDEQVRMAGLLDDIGDAGKWVLDNVVPIAEVVVPIVAPQAAPIVAAERALRTGVKLGPEDAKKATVAATALGNAVAVSQGVEPKTSSTSSTLESPLVKAAREDMERAKAEAEQARRNKEKTYLLVGLGIAVFFLARGL